MPRVASSTGLVAARLRPVRRPKPKKVELQGSSMPAPFTLRPFAGLFNPYSYGCSVLCNHPADGDAKEVVRRAKDNWASEGKALLLLPREVASNKQRDQTGENDEGQDAVAAVPEELFRRYTETDSRPTSPNFEDVCETEIGPEPPRPTLVLDLRAANSHELQQENETLSWRALTLEPVQSTRRSDFSGSPVTGRRKALTSSRHRSAASTSPVRSVPVVEISDAASTRSAPARSPQTDGDEDEDDEDEDDSSADKSPMRRRGKLRRKKRKSRRCSIYGQQTEVREPPDPLETQVSQIDESSRRTSNASQIEEKKQVSHEKTTLPVIKHDMPSSFLPPDVLKELSRHLDQETVEWEFNAKRRFALEEAWRVTRDLHPAGRVRQVPVQPAPLNAPRLFYRQSSRFELLNSHSLVGKSPLDYLGRHVHVSEARKLTFERPFARHREDVASGEVGPRRLQGRRLFEALAEVMGRELEPREVELLGSLLGEEEELTSRLLDFRTWCGVCALAERLLPRLPAKDVDPPAWLERADFEGLERRLAAVTVDPKLARMLRLIRDS